MARETGGGAEAEDLTSGHARRDGPSTQLIQLRGQLPGTAPDVFVLPASVHRFPLDNF